MTEPSLADVQFAAFVRRAAEFLKIGFLDARSQIDSTTDEVLVTEYIVAAMNARSTSGKLPGYLIRFEASDDAKVGHPDRHGKHRRIIDIRVISTGGGRPVFEVEAKCLRKSSNTIGDYTGKEGMMLFINDEYARNFPVGGMLGYIQTDDPNHWKDQLAKKLRNDSSTLGLIGFLKDSVEHSFEHSYESEHRRQSGTTIKIHHFFAVCC